MNREINFPSFPLFSHLPENRRRLNDVGKEMLEKGEAMGLQVGQNRCLFVDSRVMGEEPVGAGFAPNWSRSEVMEGEREFHSNLTPNLFAKKQLETFWNLVSEEAINVVEAGVKCRLLLCLEIVDECLARLKRNGLRARVSLMGSGVHREDNDQFFYENFHFFVSNLIPDDFHVQSGTHCFQENGEDSVLVLSFFLNLKDFFSSFSSFIESRNEISVENCYHKYQRVKTNLIQSGIEISELVRKSVFFYRNYFPNLLLPWNLDPTMFVVNRNIVKFRSNFGIDPSFLPLAYMDSEEHTSHPFLEDDSVVRLPAAKRRKLEVCLNAVEREEDFSNALRENEVNNAVSPFENSIHCNFQFLVQFCSDFSDEISRFAFEEMSRKLTKKHFLNDETSSLFKEFSTIPVPEFLLFKNQLESLKTRNDALFFSLYSQKVFFSSYRYSQLYSVIEVYRLMNWVKFWGFSLDEAYGIEELNGLAHWNVIKVVLSFFRDNNSVSLGSLGTWIRTRMGTDVTDSFRTEITLADFVNLKKVFVLIEEVNMTGRYNNKIESLLEFEAQYLRARRNDPSFVSVSFPNEMIVPIYKNRRKRLWKVRLVEDNNEMREIKKQEGWEYSILIDYREEGKVLKSLFGNSELKARRPFNEGFISFSIEESVGAIVYRGFPSMGAEDYSQLMRNCVSEISVSSKSAEVFLAENEFDGGNERWKFAFFDQFFPINTRTRLMIALSFLSMSYIIRSTNFVVIKGRIFGETSLNEGLPGGARNSIPLPDLHENIGKRSIFYLQMQRRQIASQEKLAYSISFPSSLDLAKNLAFYSVSLRSRSSEMADFSDFIARNSASYQVFGYTNQNSRIYPVCFGIGVLSFQFFKDRNSGVVPMAGSLPFPARSEFIHVLKRMGFDERQGVFCLSDWTKQILNSADPELLPFLPEGVQREDVVRKMIEEESEKELAVSLEEITRSPFQFPSSKEMMEKNAFIFGGCCWFNAIMIRLEETFKSQIIPFDPSVFSRFPAFVDEEKRRECIRNGLPVIEAFKLKEFLQAFMMEWVLSFRLKSLFSKSNATDFHELIYAYQGTPLFILQNKILEEHVSSKQKISTKKEEEFTLVGGRMNMEDQRNALDWLCLIIAGMFGYAIQIRLREVKYKEGLDYKKVYCSDENKWKLKEFSNSFSTTVSSGIKKRQSRKPGSENEFPTGTSFREARNILLNNSNEDVLLINEPIVEIKLMYLYQHVLCISQLEGTKQILEFILNLHKFFLFPDEVDEVGCYDLGYTNSVHDQLKWINSNFELFVSRFLKQKFSGVFHSLSLLQRDEFQKKMISVLTNLKKKYWKLIDFSKGETAEDSEFEKEEIERIHENFESDPVFSQLCVGVKGERIPSVIKQRIAEPMNIEEENKLQKRFLDYQNTFALFLDFETYISKKEQPESSNDKEEVFDEEEHYSLLGDDFSLQNENDEEQGEGTIEDLLSCSTKKTKTGKVQIGSVVPFAMGLTSNRSENEFQDMFIWLKESMKLHFPVKREKGGFIFNENSLKRISEFDQTNNSWAFSFWEGVFTLVLKNTFFPSMMRKFLFDRREFEARRKEHDEALKMPGWEMFLQELNSIKGDQDYSVIKLKKSEEGDENLQFGVVDSIPVYAHNGARFDYFFLLKNSNLFDFVRILKHSGFIQIISQINFPLHIDEMFDRDGFQIFSDPFSFDHNPWLNDEQGRLYNSFESIFERELNSFLSSFPYEDFSFFRVWIENSFFPIEWKVLNAGKEMKKKNVYTNILSRYSYSVASKKKKRNNERLLPAKKGKNGMLWSALKSIVLSFQDSYRIAPLPLRTLCSSYKCDVQKGIFPYSALTEEMYQSLAPSFSSFFAEVLNGVIETSNIQFVEVEAVSFANGKSDLKEMQEEMLKFKNGEKEKDSIISCVSSFSGSSVRYPILFSLVEYLINDVLGLEEVIAKHSSALIHSFHCNPFRTLTLPSFAYKFLASSNALSDATFASSIPVDLFVRRGVKGGATMLSSHKFSLKENYLSWARRHGMTFSFPPDDEKDLQDLMLRSSDSSYNFCLPVEGSELKVTELLKYFRTCAAFGAISNLDVNSLYPSAMTMFPLPSGDAYWLGGEDDNLQIMEFLKNQWKEGEFSAPLMVMCDFDYGKKSSMMPLIGEKRAPAKEIFAGVPRMMYDFVPKTAAVLSTPEIEILYRFYSGKITKIYGVILYSEWTYEVGQLIYGIYQKRLALKKEKNPVELAYKLIMNSLYGKWIQQYPDKEITIFDLRKTMSELDPDFDETLDKSQKVLSSIFSNESCITANWREFSYLCVSLFDTVRSIVFLPNGECIVERKMLKFNGNYSILDSKIVPNGVKLAKTAVSIPSVWGVYVLGNSKLIDAKYLSLLNQGDQVRFYGVADEVQLGNGCYYMDTDSFHLDVRTLSTSIVDSSGMIEIDEEGKEVQEAPMRKPNISDCFKIGKELGNISSDIEIDGRVVEFFKANYEEEFLDLIKFVQLSPQENLILFLFFKFFSLVPCFVVEGRYVATKTYCEEVLTLSIGDEEKGQDRRKLYWSTKVHARAKGINIKDIYSLIGSKEGKDIVKFYSDLIEKGRLIESNQTSFAAGTKFDEKMNLMAYQTSKKQSSAWDWASRPIPPLSARDNLLELLNSEEQDNEWLCLVRKIWKFVVSSQKKDVFNLDQIFDFVLNLRPPSGWDPVPGSLMTLELASMTSNRLCLDLVERKKEKMELFAGESKHPAAASMMSVLNGALISNEKMEEEEQKKFQSSELFKFFSSQGTFNFKDKDCPFVVDPNFANSW